MDISDQGVAFIASFEGFRPKLYTDLGGHATIGYGHMVHTGPVDGTEPDDLRDGITQEEALDLLKEDCQHAVGVVNRMVTVPLTQNQFDTLVSFVFNLGEGNFGRSDLLARLNNKEYAAVPEELSRWTRAGGVRYKGLIRRRLQEGQLWKNADYDPNRDAPAAQQPKGGETPIKVIPNPIQQMPPGGIQTTTKIPWVSQLDKFPTSDDYEFDCLAACATMQLQHAGLKLNVDQVVQRLGVPPKKDGGYHILDLTAERGKVPEEWGKIWVHRAGLSWAQVAVEANANRGVIAYLNAARLPLRWRYKGYDGLHFVLITGIVGNQVHYLDPNWELEVQGRCWLHQADFAKAWTAKNYQGLLIRDR